MTALSPRWMLLAVAGMAAGCVSVPPAPREVAVCALQPTLSERGSARIVDGFPGLASQRFLGGLLQEQSAQWGAEQWQAWLARSRALALQDGLEGSGTPVLDGCARQLSALLTPARKEALVKAAAVASDYSDWQRILGAYPLTGIGLRAGISGYQQETLKAWQVAKMPEETESFAAYAVASPSSTRVVQTAGRLRKAAPDALGIPNVPADLARALAEDFAPLFLVETRSAADIPGRPTIEGGLGVNPDRPVLSWRLDYTMAHGVVLPQISWVLWFSERPAEGRWDPYSGALDGVVWRATFGPDGWPVAYDSIHPCGCYHIVFPTRHMALPTGGGFWDEDRLQPLAPASWGQVTVVVDAATHYLRTVAAGDALSMPLLPLQLEPWAETREVLAPAIAEDGVIAGSERLERYWLWPSGVRSPGAMRDWGRHATAFIGEQHFDDLRALEPYIAPAVVAPPPARP